MLISFRLARDSVYPTLVDALFTQVTLLLSSGAAPSGDVGLVFRTCRRGTGAAGDHHVVDLPGYVATLLYSSDAGHIDERYVVDTPIGGGEAA
jgi:hypothetical protein